MRNPFVPKATVLALVLFAVTIPLVAGPAARAPKSGDTLSVALVGQGVVTATAAPTMSGAATAEGSPAAGDPHDHLPDLDRDHPGTFAIPKKRVDRPGF